MAIEVDAEEEEEHLVVGLEVDQGGEVVREVEAAQEEDRKS